MLPEETSLRRSSVIRVSGEIRPPLEVITKAPSTLGGALQKAWAYLSLPRKYRPLMKLKSSPRDAPRRRSRTANSKSALSRIRNWARIPAMFAGERRKILHGPRSRF